MPRSAILPSNLDFSAVLNGRDGENHEDRVGDEHPNGDRGLMVHGRGRQEEAASEGQEQQQAHRQQGRERLEDAKSGPYHRGGDG